MLHVSSGWKLTAFPSEPLRCLSVVIRITKSGKLRIEIPLDLQYFRNAYFYRKVTSGESVNDNHASAGNNGATPTKVLTHILMVEDNPRDAVFISRALRKYSAAGNVISLRRGQEALDYLFETSNFADRNKLPVPQLVILDLHMPVLDGFEVLKIIRLYERLSDIPVVIFSGSENEADIKRSFAMGANSYVVKLHDIEKFIQVVDEVASYWLNLNRQPPKQSPPYQPSNLFNCPVVLHHVNDLITGPPLLTIQQHFLQHPPPL